MTHVVKIETLWTCLDEIEEETKFYTSEDVNEVLAKASAKIEQARKYESFAWRVSVRLFGKWSTLYESDNWEDELEMRWDILN